MSAYKKIEALLQQGECLTVYDAAGKVGVAHQTACAAIRRMYDSEQIHIVSWRRPVGKIERGPWQGVYAWGAGEDMPRPIPIPLLDRVKKYQKSEKGLLANAAAKARRKQDPEKHMIDLMRHRARYARNRDMRVEKLDPLLAILMGKRV